MTGTSRVMNLEDYLRRDFLGCDKNFNAVHINAQSIPAHFRDIELTFYRERYIHAILVSESYLKPHMDEISPTLYNLPGYNLIRNDRLNRPNSRKHGGGGVAIYLRNDIPYEIIRTSSPRKLNIKDPEYLFIIINFPVRFLLGVYYRPPSGSTKYLTSLRTLLQDLRPMYDEGVIMGDFNTCLLRTKLRNRFCSLIKSVGLRTVLHSSATHHQPNKVPSLIDLIIVSNENNVMKHGQRSACFSYHKLIFVSYVIQGMSNSITSRERLTSPTHTEYTIPPSKEEEIYRSARLSYKCDYESTGSIVSLNQYQQNEIWKNHEGVCRRMRKCEKMGKRFCPKKRKRVQLLLAGPYDNEVASVTPERSSGDTSVPTQTIDPS